MDAEKCEFVASNTMIEVIPSLTDERPILLISGDIGAFEAGVPATVPIWMALLMKRKHQCKIVTPAWMEVEELKKLLAAETENQGLGRLPDYFFEITHMLVRDAKDDIFEVEAVKSLVQDIYDRRDAKLRTSAIAFLSQVRRKNFAFKLESFIFRTKPVTPNWIASSRSRWLLCEQHLMRASRWVSFSKTSTIRHRNN